MVGESRTANAAGKGGGPSGRRRGSDVPRKPGNAGGGKGPCFWCVCEGGKDAVIGDESGQHRIKFGNFRSNCIERRRTSRNSAFISSTTRCTGKTFCCARGRWRKPTMARRAWMERASRTSNREQGVMEWLNGLGKDLHDKTYEPQPVRRVMIEKPGGGERPLGIPTVSANCTRAQFAFGMGGDPPSVPSASRPAFPGIESAPNRRY